MANTWPKERRLLGTEAEQCIGEDASYVGATRVDVEIDPSIPPTDPTEPPLPVPDVQKLMGQLGQSPLLKRP